jgi:hypothetical protein
MTQEIALTWASGESLSNEIDVSSKDKVIGFYAKTGFNQTIISFVNVVADKSNASVVDNTGTEVAITIDNTIDVYVALDPLWFAGVNKIKVRRGTQATPYSSAVENTAVSLFVREY